MRINLVGFLALLGLASIANGQGIITTVAGTATCCNDADGQQAVNTWIDGLSGITRDTQGNMYFFDGASSVVKKINTAGVVSTYAGNGTPGYSGDGGPATSAKLQANSFLSGLAVDSQGNLYIADGGNNVIRKVTAAGIISTYAGNGTGGFLGENVQATTAMLFAPSGIALDSAGNLYISDNSNSRVRKVTPAGIITTFAGNGNVAFSGDGVQATTTSVHNPSGIALDTQGNVYISEGSDGRVRKVDKFGVITTYAGQAVKSRGFSGDGGLATAAQLSGPTGLAVDQFGNLFIADNGNARIRKVNAAGIITTYAGIDGNSSTALGDGGLATNAFLGVLGDLVLDSSRNLYLVSLVSSPKRIRKIVPTGDGFIASPISLSFSYNTGDSNPGGQSVTVSSSGATLIFTTAVTTASGGNWLSVNLPGGVTPGILTVSVNPGALGSGTYQGTILLTSTDPLNSPLAIPVTLTVSGAGTPLITSVGNALGYQAKLAPGVVFVVKGGNLGPANLAQGVAPNYQTSLAGTSVNFTPIGGGAAIDAKMVYTLNFQIAAFLPSSVAPGVYAVRVTYNGITSAPMNTTVVARSYGIASADSSGVGLAQATIGNINSGFSLTRFSAGSVSFGGFNWILGPAHPGDTLVFWGTGGGADLLNDTGGTSGDQTVAGNFKVIIEGRQITPFFAGASSGYPGLFQINFTLPGDLALDCFATAQVSAGGELSNTVNVPIAAAGQTSCVDPNMPSGILSKLDSGTNITLAAFALAKLTTTSGGIDTTQETGSGAVLSFTPSEWIILNSGPSFGACRVYDRTYAVGGIDPATASASLDAGTSLPLTGPGLAVGAMGKVVTTLGPFYSTSLSAGSLIGGTYALHGPGGTQVGGFDTSVLFPTSFTATNWSSITLIDRTQPLTFTWSGASIDQVTIVVSTAVVANGTQHLSTLNCTVPGAPGTYTIPAAALAYLSPVAATGASFGNMTLQGISVRGTFTANLTFGGHTDLGTFQGGIGVSKNVAVQ